MRRILRVVLIAGVALVAAGTQVAPHEHVAGWTHEGLDHPPSAVHATLLEHVRYLLAQEQQETAPATPSFVPAPLALEAATIVLALFAFGTPRPWRPGRLGVARFMSLLAGTQLALAPVPAPPRTSLSFRAS